MQFTVEKIINELPGSYEDFLTKYKSKLRAELIHKQSHWIYTRCRLAEAQNWKCCFCGCEMIETPHSKNSATIEHIIPYSKSKNNHINNLAVSCQTCNKARGVMDICEFNERKEKISNSEMTRKERIQEKKFKKYIRRIEKFKQEGLPVNEKISSIEEWVDSLIIRDDYRQKLREVI